MNDIFDKHFFPEFVKANCLKPHVNGLNDPTRKDFRLLTNSFMMKEEVKVEHFELEYIRSFLEAAKILAKEDHRQNGATNYFLIFNYSYAIPVLVMTRHCMELSIKRAIHRSGGKPKREHDLEKLWTQFIQLLPKHLNAEDGYTLEQMKAYICSINELDKTGTKLRYHRDDAGLTQNQSLWINDIAITDMLELFVEQMESLYMM